MEHKFISVINQLCSPTQTAISINELDTDFLNKQGHQTNIPILIYFTQCN